MQNVKFTLSNELPFIFECISADGECEDIAALSYSVEANGMITFFCEVIRTTINGSEVIALPFRSISNIVNVRLKTEQIGGYKATNKPIQVASAISNETNSAKKTGEETIQADSKEAERWSQSILGRNTEEQADEIFKSRLFEYFQKEKSGFRIATYINYLQQTTEYFSSKKPNELEHFVVEFVRDRLNTTKELELEVRYYLSPQEIVQFKHFDNSLGGGLLKIYQNNNSNPQSVIAQYEGLKTETQKNFLKDFMKISYKVTAYFEYVKLGQSTQSTESSSS